MVEFEDKLSIRALGAAQEVGGSCFLVSAPVRGRMVHIMLDCGVYPARQGLGSLPHFDNVPVPDVILITHVHNDHCAALPYFLDRNCGGAAYKGKIFATDPTKAMLPFLLGEYIRRAGDNHRENIGLYGEEELQAAIDKVEVINYGQQVEVAGVRIECYNAGHILGAAMFLVDIAGKRVLYTGDYSCVEDRHLMAADIPRDPVDICLVEATYGIREHPSAMEREEDFVSTIRDTLQNGGSVLIPISALGRAQELWLILEDYWSEHQELNHYPVYYTSTLAQKCIGVYDRFVSLMNKSIRAKHQNASPFDFRFINYLKSVDKLPRDHPCVVIASPGMLQSGDSRRIFEMWCNDPRNRVIFCGFCAKETLARDVIDSKKTFRSMDGRSELEIRCEHTLMSFCAHADCRQTTRFLEQVNPRDGIILVHGEKTEMERLMECLKGRSAIHTKNIFMPETGNEINFELISKTGYPVTLLGELADEASLTSAGEEVSGVIVRDMSTYKMMKLDEIKRFTNLSTANIFFTEHVPFPYELSALVPLLSMVYDDIMLTEDGKLLIVAERVMVKVEEEGVVEIKWQSGIVSDIVVDSVLSFILSFQIDPGALKRVEELRERLAGVKEGPNSDAESMAFILKKHFGDARVLSDGYRIEISSPLYAKKAILDMRDFSVSCEDRPFEHDVNVIRSLLRDCCASISLAPPATKRMKEEEDEEETVVKDELVPVKDEPMN